MSPATSSSPANREEEVRSTKSKPDHTGSKSVWERGERAGSHWPPPSHMWILPRRSLSLHGPRRDGRHPCAHGSMWRFGWLTCMRRWRWGAQDISIGEWERECER
jgi:hypothetical protein